VSYEAIKKQIIGENKKVRDGNRYKPVKQKKLMLVGERGWYGSN